MNKFRYKIMFILLFMFLTFSMGICKVSAAGATSDGEREAARSKCLENAKKTVEKKFKDSDEDYKNLAINILYEECVEEWDKKNEQPDIEAGGSGGEKDKDIGEEAKLICEEVLDGIPNLTDEKRVKLYESCKSVVYQKKCLGPTNEARKCYLKDNICKHADLMHSSACAAYTGGSTNVTEDACVGMDAVVFYAVYVVKVLHIAVPIILILWASIDLLKSIISRDEKEILAARKPIIQRLVTAVLVFVIPWAVNFLVLSLTGRDTRGADWSRCWRKAWSGGNNSNSDFDIKNWD